MQNMTCWWLQNVAYEAAKNHRQSTKIEDTNSAYRWTITGSLHPFRIAAGTERVHAWLSTTMSIKVVLGNTNALMPRYVS